MPLAVGRCRLVPKGRRDFGASDLRTQVLTAIGRTNRNQVVSDPIPDTFTESLVHAASVHDRAGHCKRPRFRSRRNLVVCPGASVAHGPTRKSSVTRRPRRWGGKVAAMANSQSEDRAVTAHLVVQRGAARCGGDIGRLTRPVTYARLKGFLIVRSSSMPPPATPPPSAGNSRRSRSISPSST